MKRFECSALGNTCDFTAQAETAEEVLAKAEEHMATAHGMLRGEETRNMIRPKILDA